MNDLERELKTLLDQKFREVRVPPSAPERVLRRARRHQWATAVAGGAVAILVVAGTVLGARSILRSDERVPADRPKIETVDGVTIAFPRAWSLVPCDKMSFAGSPCYSDDSAVLLLSNDPTVTSTDLGCPNEDGTLTDSVILFVQNVPLATDGPRAAPWPVRSENQDVTDGCFLGWSFSRAGWTAAGRTFEGLITFAPGASVADRSALQDAFESMSFSRSTRPAGPKALVTGTAAGIPWRLVLSQSDAPLTLDLYYGEEGGSIGFGFPRSDQPRPIEFASRRFGRGDGATWVVFGPVTRDAIGVHVAGTSIEARVIELGSASEAPFNAFVLEIDAPVRGEPIILVEGPAGRIAREPLSLGAVS